MNSSIRFTSLLLVSFALGGCGSSDPEATPGDGGAAVATIAMDAPVILADLTTQCTEPHTACMTVQMPDMIPGPATHLAMAYYKNVPVMTPAGARGVLQMPPLAAGQMFRIKAGDGTLTGLWYPVVLLYMPNGGDVIAVDNLDYTAEATQMYDLTGGPLNIPETLKLIYGI
jgi:hypothetical protein